MSFCDRCDDFVPARDQDYDDLCARCRRGGRGGSFITSVAIGAVTDSALLGGLLGGSLLGGLLGDSLGDD